MSSKLWIPALAVATAGCTSLDPVSGSPDPGFGEAVKYDMAIQTIDPDPVHDEAGEQPGSSGAVAVGAVKRYRTGQVKAVESQTTTTSTSEGSGNSGGPR